jgi:hypothetical protein
LGGNPLAELLLPKHYRDAKLMLVRALTLEQRKHRELNFARRLMGLA